MIRPINTHFLIEPLTKSSFMQGETKFEEIGIVVELPYDYEVLSSTPTQGTITKGCKVFFDSWCAAKYPNEDGGHFWLVKHEDIRAIENVE